MGIIVVIFGVIVLMGLTSTIVVAIALAVVSYAKRKIHLKLLFIIYSVLLAIFTIFFFTWFHDINTMNTKTVAFPINTNMLQFDFVPNHSGLYAIRLKLQNKQLLDEIKHCSFLEMDKMTNSKPVDKTQLKNCHDQYDENNIDISINGKKKESFSMILAFEDDSAWLDVFDAIESKNYSIQISISKNIKKLIAANPIISVDPSGVDSFGLMIIFFSFYLPFSVSAMVMLVYIYRKLKIKNQ